MPGARMTRIDAVDGPVTHAERQARTIEDLRSDPGRTRGIARKRGDPAFAEQAPAGPLRAFASRANGIRRSLGPHEARGAVPVVDEADPASGGAVMPIERDVVLCREPSARQGGVAEADGRPGRMIDGAPWAAARTSTPPSPLSARSSATMAGGAPSRHRGSNRRPCSFESRPPPAKREEEHP